MLYQVSFIFVTLIYAKQGGAVKINAYNFENILRTEIFSINAIDNCSLSDVNKALATSGALLYLEAGPIKLKYCMFKAAYTVVAVKKSNVWDDASFLTEHSELIPSYYSMTPITCERIWMGETVLIPGFSDYKFFLTGKVLKSLGNSEKDIEYSQKLSKIYEEREA